MEELYLRVAEMLREIRHTVALTESGISATINPKPPTPHTELHLPKKDPQSYGLNNNHPALICLCSTVLPCFITHNFAIMRDVICFFNLRLARDQMVDY